MPREFFNYWFDEEENIIETAEGFYYVITKGSLEELKECAKDASFRSTIEYSGGEEEGYWYRVGKPVSICKNGDGTWIGVFELVCVS